jgi:hypothetical protein
MASSVSSFRTGRRSSNPGWDYWNWPSNQDHGLQPRHLSGRYCYEQTSWQTFLDNQHLALEKDLSRGGDRSEDTTRSIIPVG